MKLIPKSIGLSTDNIFFNLVLLNDKTNFTYFFLDKFTTLVQQCVSNVCPQATICFAFEDLKYSVTLY